MSTTNVDHESESLDVRVSIVGVENDKTKRPELVAGEYAEKTPVFEELEGKKLFPTKVVKQDDGTIVVMYKKNGEVQTITLDEFASKKIVENRRIKGSRAVPAKKAKGTQAKELKAKGDGR